MKRERSLVTQWRLRENQPRGHRSAAQQISAPCFSPALSPQTRTERHGANVRDTSRAVRVKRGISTPQIPAPRSQSAQPAATDSYKGLEQSESAAPSVRSRRVCAGLEQEHCASKLKLASGSGWRCGQCPMSGRETSSGLCQNVVIRSFLAGIRVTVCLTDTHLVLLGDWGLFRFAGAHGNIWILEY